MLWVGFVGYSVGGFCGFVDLVGFVGANKVQRR